jgi:D-3-phosphoglycerate dehydrogenase
VFVREIYQNESEVILKNVNRFHFEIIGPNFLTFAKVTKMTAVLGRKALIVLDHLFTQELADICTAPLKKAGWQVDEIHWSVETIEDQRTEVRRLENEGPSDSDTMAPLDQPYDYEVIITQFAPISARAIANGRNLKLIAINRAGIQNLDVEAAAKHSVEIFKVPGRNTNAVAEHTVGLMLAHLRFIARAHASLKQNIWMEDFAAPGPRELAEVTVGIVGYGLIGKRVHEMLTPFKSKIKIYDPFVTEAPAGADLVSLEDLLKASDVVTVHVPLNDKTRNLISTNELALMPKGAIVVNTARAEIIDQTALRAAIKNGVIAGAALDVFDAEPLDASDILIASETTTVTPHLAGTTRQAFIQGPVWIGERMQTLTQTKA